MSLTLSPLKYAALGACFGVILIKSEAISWFRIHEMFKLTSFHMYGIMGSALVTAMISIAVIKRFNVKTFDGSAISIAPKNFHKGILIGGILFGIGWALTGACPGPLFAEVGAGYSVAFVSFLSAIAGTWAYGALKDYLPH